MDYAFNDSKNYMQGFDKSIAFNYDQYDWIHNYGGGYYNKWEAEENILDPSLPAGIKHAGGEAGTVNGTSCWVVPQGATGPVNNFIYGPHSSQERQYRYDNYVDSYTLQYHLNVRMKIIETNLPDASINVDLAICRISVKYTCLYNNIISTFDILSTPRIVTVGELSTEGFTDIGLDYQYPNNLLSNSNVNPAYIDKNPTIDDRGNGMGVQYIVDWLGGPRIAVDYLEIYDNRLMNDYKNNNAQFISNITTKASQVNVSNLKYWHGQDAPLVVDQYLPYRFVDSILTTYNYPPLITDFYPMWNNQVNGWNSMAKWNSIAKPSKLFFWYYPMWPENTPQPYVGMEYMLELLRTRLQEAYNIQPDFYYMAPAMQFKTDANTTEYRKPVGTEFRAMVMLALAHGCKGLFFMDYYSYWSDPNDTYIRCEGLIDVYGNPTPLWHYIHDKISPRINGTLGNMLLNLSYTGQYIQTVYHGLYPDNPVNSTSYDYITLNAHGNDYNWHIGFLTHSTLSNNKFFLLTNLRAEGSREAMFTINNNSGFTNLRVRDYENPSLLDTTISSTTTFTVPVDSGDGRLFQVIPVAKYGGIISSDELISGTNSLTGEMSIGADATLTISGVYDIYNKITVNGTLVVDSGATLNFHNGASLDIKGNIQANKATFNFSPNAAGNIGLIWFNLLSSGSIFNGNTVNNCGNILLQPWSNTTIENCNINNSINGISVYACTAQIINNTIYHPAHFGIYDSDNNRDVLITGNKIYHDSTQGKYNPYSIGIYIDNIYYNSWIANNDVQGFNCGIFTVEWSYLTFANPNTDVSNPNNRFMHNHIGIRATDCSHIFAGDPNDPGGYQDLSCQFNTISDNDIPVILTDNSTLFATNNYWGPDVSCDNPPPGDFCWDYCTGECGIGVGINDNSGTFQFGPDFLTEDPWAPPETGGPTKTRIKPVNKYHSSKSLADNEAGNKTSTAKLTRSLIDVDVKDNLMTAMALEKKGMLNEANNIYENMISKGNNVRAALSCLVHQKNKSSKEDISNRLRRLLKKNPDNSSAINSVLGRLSLSDNKFDDAMVLFNNVMLNDPQGYDGISARFEKLFAYLHIKNDKTKAKELLAEIISMNLTDYKSQTQIQMAEDLLGLSKNNNQQNNAVNLMTNNLIPKTYALFQNFPNPFNPETTIRYQIPKAGLVTLKVYDILGREITTLVNENKIEGSYDFTFNASGFASGVYIYQLRVNDYVSSKKMILLK